MTPKELTPEQKSAFDEWRKNGFSDEWLVFNLTNVLESRLVSTESENALLRKLLWIRHDSKHSYGLYGDDGEMQCGVCLIDFKRMSAQDIENTWTDRATKLLRQIQAEKANAVNNNAVPWDGGIDTSVKI